MWKARSFQRCLPVRQLEPKRRVLFICIVDRHISAASNDAENSSNVKRDEATTTDGRRTSSIQNLRGSLKRALNQPRKINSQTDTWQEELKLIVERKRKMDRGRKRNPPPPHPLARTSAAAKQPLAGMDMAALHELSKEINQLQQKSQQLEHHRSPRVWEIDSIDDAEDGRTCSPQQQELFLHCTSTINRMREFLKNLMIRPDRKHRAEFKSIVEYLLQIYADCGIILDDDKNVVSVYDEVLKLIHLYRSFRLELSHKMCDSAILVAALENRWNDAAKLYSSHIDPEENGFIPVTSNSDINGAVNGLYCIARAALESGSPPVESVFNGVRNLSTVSPPDAEKYVLAAGTALGHAGEWESLRNYLQSSYRSFELGQPLVAAVMHACILNERNDEAMAVFDDLVNGDLSVAAEWQWGGGQYKLHPCCRDLAMRALGGMSTKPEEHAEMKERALDLYHQAKDENCRISVAALCGVVSACERNGSWEDVLRVYLPVIDEANSLDRLSLFLASKDNLHDIEMGSESLQTSEELVSELVVFLDHVMRACNYVKQFGVALLCLRLHELSAASPVTVSYRELSKLHQDEKPRHSFIVQSLLPSIYATRDTVDLLPTTMASLCGIHSAHEATALFEAYSTVMDQSDLPEDKRFRDKYDVYGHAVTLRDSTPPRFHGNWDSTHRHIHRLTAAFSILESGKETITEEDKRLLSVALATAIHECVAISQPETGIALGKWVERRRLPISWTEDPPVVFSIGEEGPCLPILLSDPLLASAIEVFTSSGRVDSAQFLIQSYLGNDRPPADWSLSYLETMKALFAQGQAEDGMVLFRAILANGKNPDLFCSAAKGLKAAGDDKSIVDIYRQALASGCFSEELSLLAMQSVATTRRGRQAMPLLRSIISEIAKATGTDQASWLAQNYWTMKRYLRFDTARLLMGWDDFKTSHLDELELAIETLESRMKGNLTPKTAALFAIVKAAANYESLRIPFNKTKVAKVPRDKEAWIELLGVVLEASKDTSLLEKPEFIDETAVALWRLDCFVECVELVTDAMSRGVTLNKAALQSAFQSAKNANVEEMTADIKLLLAEAR